DPGLRSLQSLASSGKTIKKSFEIKLDSRDELLYNHPSDRRAVARGIESPHTLLAFEGRTGAREAAGTTRGEKAGRRTSSPPRPLREFPPRAASRQPDANSSRRGG